MSDIYSSVHPLVRVSLLTTPCCLTSVQLVTDHRCRQNVAHEPLSECVTDLLTTFLCLLLLITEQMHGNMESACIFYISKKILSRRHLPVCPPIRQVTTNQNARIIRYNKLTCSSKGKKSTFILQEKV